MKKRIEIDNFVQMEHSDLTYWYCANEHKWLKNPDSNKVVHSWKNCHTIRAFKRNLKQIAKKQPELIGEKFTLLNTHYVISKNGKYRSLDIELEVK